MEEARSLVLLRISYWAGKAFRPESPTYTKVLDSNSDTLAS